MAKKVQTTVDRNELTAAIASLKKTAVNTPTVFVVPGNASNGLLVLKVNKFNRVVTWHHAGTLAKSMRVWHDAKNPDRYFELVTTITLGETRGTTDGQHREIGKVLAYGTREEVAELCHMYGVVDDEGNPDFAKLATMSKMELEDKDGNWIGYNGDKYGYPRVIMSVDTDDHYYKVADQIQLKRTGADALSGDPNIANTLVSVGLSFKDAEKILRLVYLRCMRSINGDGSKFGSTKRGGNIPANRYIGFYELFGKYMVEAWKQYIETVHDKNNGPAFHRDRLEQIGVVELITVMTIGRLYQLSGDYVDADTFKDNLEPWEKDNGFTPLIHADPFNFADALRLLGSYPISLENKKLTDNVACFLAEVTQQNRIQQREKVAALCSIFGHEVYSTTWSEWSELFLPFTRDNTSDDRDIEQFVSHRFYGPDSTGWNANHTATIRKGAAK